MKDRANRIRIVEYERHVIRNANAAIKRVFDVDRTASRKSDSYRNSIPEAEEAVAALQALDEVVSQRYDELKNSCATEGHDWIAPEFGQERICAVCGAPDHDYVSEYGQQPFTADTGG